MQEFRCEYEENGVRVVLRGLLRDIQRTVGSRHVLLDGVLGHFTVANDEHASVQFVQARSSKVRGITHGTRASLRHMALYGSPDRIDDHS